MPRSKPPADVTDLEQWRGRSKSSEAADPRATPIEKEPVWDGTMRILVFATDRPGTLEASAPFAIIPEAAAAFLPQHPGGLEWRYFATMGLDDQMLAVDRETINAALRDPGYYISDRPLNR